MTRDNLIWAFGFWGSLLAFAVTLTDIIPPQYAGKVSAIAALCGFIAAKLGNSPLPGDRK
jgi:hypothetical protein